MKTTKEAVIKATSDLADEKGLNNVSLKAVAQKLNIRTPSLYNHIESLDKFGIGGANMPTRTPIPVSRAMRQISANLDLARRQQRIPVALLAERAGLSMPTVTKMLRTGNGSFENFLRIARLLGLLDGVQQATDPLNTDIGKLRADEDTPKRIR